MAGVRCPFRKTCRYAEVCEDHRWFCVWGFWLGVAASLAVTTYLLWRVA